jgi:hypothetical protein|tara:strand:+ start:1492 stop:1713 length:222 start_codon:yes stop_codon:yes gene_type:complete
VTEKTATDMALDALELIARHERECGLRWTEATMELKHLSDAVAAHGKRWERLAWLLVTSFITLATAVLLRSVL